MSVDFMTMMEVTDANFESEVLKAGVPVAVDVWAVWCGPCRMYSPIFEEVAREMDGKVKFVKVNADECEGITSKFNISSIPTTLLISKGQLKAMNVGAVPKETLKKWIEKNM